MRPGFGGPHQRGGGRDALPLQHFGGDVNLPARREPGEGAQKAGERIGDARIARRIRSARFAAFRQNDGGEPEQGRSRAPAIGLELPLVRHRLVVEIDAARLDQIGESRARQAEGADRVDEGGCDRMGAHVAARLALDGVDPPLHADFAGHGIGHRFADARDFEAEGVERVQARTQRGRREHAGQPAVAVVQPQELLAMAVVFRHFRRAISCVSAFGAGLGGGFGHRPVVRRVTRR